MPPVWSRANEAERLRQSLAGWLALVDASGLTSKQTTKLLTDSISEWAMRRRWRVELEAPALVERMSVNGPMRGRLDLLCTRRWRRAAVAIEIDRAHKRWSLDKLVAEADAGNIALWVRWRGASVIDAPPNVGLVDIRATIAADSPHTDDVVGADLQ